MFCTDITASSEKSSCTYTVRGRYEYTGTQSHTCSDKQCTTWAADTNNRFTYKDFPVDLNMSSLKYCRNPALLIGGDYCRVSGGNKYDWENCCTPPCSGIL